MLQNGVVKSQIRESAILTGQSGELEGQKAQVVAAPILHLRPSLCMIFLIFVGVFALTLPKCHRRGTIERLFGAGYRFSLKCLLCHLMPYLGRLGEECFAPHLKTAKKAKGHLRPIACLHR